MYPPVSTLRGLRASQVRSVRRVGAAHGGTLSNWNPSRVSQAQEPLDREQMQQRSEDIIANDGHAASIRDTFVTNGVGTGLTPQSKLDHEALGIAEADARAIEKAQERAFRLWMREAHIGRRMHFADCQQLTVGNTVTYGDSVWIGRMLKEEDRIRKGRKFSFALQDVHPIRMKTPPEFTLDLNVRDGIYLDEDGEPLGYFFGNTDCLGQLADYQYVQARQAHRQIVFHSFRVREPEQVRGIPLLAPVLKLFRDKYDFLDYEVVAQIITASFPIAIESENPKDYGAGNTQSAEKRWFRGVRPGQVMYTNPGERVNPIQSNRPGSNFDSFFKLILRTICAVSGLPYTQVLKDFSDTNYSSARAALQEAWKLYQDYRAWLVRQFCQPVREHVLEEAYLRGLWSLPKGAPDFYGAMDLYLNCRWTPPPRGYVDPYKEILAQLKALEGGLSDYDTIFGEQGEDYEERFAQQERETDERKRRGLPVVGADTITQPDPLAIQPDPPVPPGA